MPSWDDDWQPDPGDSGSPGFLRRRAPGIREYQADPWSRAASLAAIWAAGPLAGVGYLIVRNYAGANLHCLADAIQTASTRAPAAIWQETGLGNLGGLLAGIIDGMLKALAVIAASALLGAAAGGAVGFFFFGAGAAPGAIAGAKLGLELGIAAMAWLGLGLIAAAIGKGSAALAQATMVGVRLAWSAGNQPDREFRDALIDRGATELARAVGILVRLILEGIVLYLTRGLPASTTRTFLQTARQTGVSAGQAVPRAAVAKVVAELRASKLGPQFAEWVERNWEQLLKNPKLNKPPRPVEVQPPPRTGPPAVTPSQLRKELEQEILATAKGKRPDPSTYLPKTYIDEHLAQFEGGSTKIMAKAPTATVGPPGGTFVLPKKLADEMIAKSGADVGKLEGMLGLETGALGSSPVRVDIAGSPGLRMPSGNELGANAHWKPGGFTSGGVPEATINPVPPGGYSVAPVFAPKAPL